MGKVNQAQIEFEEQKLQTLAESEGYDNVDRMLHDVFNSGTVPGICMNPDCEATYNYEPDQDRGWCEECQTNTVKSCFVLAGIM